MQCRSLEAVSHVVLRRLVQYESASEKKAAECCVIGALWCFLSPPSHPSSFTVTWHAKEASAAARRSKKLKRKKTQQQEIISTASKGTLCALYSLKAVGFVQETTF